MCIRDSISCLANKYVDDPHKVVKAGQIVKVKVLEVDMSRKRIALTMKLQETKQDRLDRRPPSAQPKQASHKKKLKAQARQTNAKQTKSMNNAMAAKLAAALKK